jgi:hypothetical protein
VCCRVICTSTNDERQQFLLIFVQVFRHAIEVARRESSSRVMLRHLEGAIKEIFSSSLLPTIKGLCAQVNSDYSSHKSPLEPV